MYFKQASEIVKVKIASRASDFWSEAVTWIIHSRPEASASDKTAITREGERKHERVKTELPSHNEISSFINYNRRRIVKNSERCDAVSLDYRDIPWQKWTSYRFIKGTRRDLASSKPEKKISQRNRSDTRRTFNKSLRLRQANAISSPRLSRKRQYEASKNPREARKRGKLPGGATKNFRYRKYIRKHVRTHVGGLSEDAMISAHDKSR